MLAQHRRSRHVQRPAQQRSTLADVRKAANTVTGISNAWVQSAKSRILARSKPQNRILTNDDPVPKPTAAQKAAPEFNDKMLADVFDASQFRKLVHKIQEKVTEMEKLVIWYNEAYGFVNTLEQEKTLCMMIDIILDAIRKAEKLMERQTENKAR